MDGRLRGDVIMITHDEIMHTVNDRLRGYAFDSDRRSVLLLVVYDRAKRPAVAPLLRYLWHQVEKRYGNDLVLET